MKKKKQYPLYLVVNAAEGTLQVILGEGLEPLAALETYSPRRGIQVLPLLIQKAMSLSGKKLKDINAIVCVKGPGSFTGLRITLSLCSGLAMARDIRVGEIEYLPLLARAIPPSGEKEIWVLTHARINTVYIQGFEGETKAPLGEASFLSIKKLPSLFKEQGKRIFLGSGVRKHEDFIKKIPGAQILSPIYDIPSPRLLLQEATTISLHYPPLSPLYLRPSEAEENLPSILQKRGLD